MTAPIAQTVHPGNGVPPTWRREMIADWLTQNGINPAHVTPDDPIRILTVPYRPATPDGEGPWLIQVIVLTQYYVNGNGAIEANLITGRPVAFQRTVPLTVPFPPDPATDGGDHGQADREAAQEAAQVGVRDSQQAQVPDTGQEACKERTGQGESSRIESAAEEGPGRRHEAVSEPEEVRRRPGEEVAQ